ncbi:ABC transporter ATP-binding protein [Fortiea contorta]|uniref:ABC transporter ATP-binding protein n=1 Tax=Fortiea contorta TaxID=1892405 RepID=UPI000344B4DD|nr:ABC transporter ATP-binding protein [Fortiea contorta]
MSDTVIKVENLGKKYILGHQQQERYTALRDVIANRAKGLVNAVQNSKGKSQHNQEEFWALNDVSFEIKEGDRVGIIGRNGAGKSTLLKILSRITEPTKGSIKIKGRVASLLEVGTGFHPELTGRENIYLNGAILGMSREEIKRKFDEIVAFAEVEKFLDTPVKRYSSGMYVRLAFAVAAHLEPEILIVDEVLAVGDAQFQKKCLGKMEDVSTREGRTVLFVSHNMTAVQQLTNTGVVLEKGKILTIKDTTTAIEKYFNSSVDRSTHIYNAEVLPRRFPDLNRQVEFLTLELENCPTKLVPADADIYLKITVRGNESIDKFRFSMTLCRVDGTPIGNFFSEEGQSLQQGEIGTYRLVLRDLRLATGIYYCNFATGKGNDKQGRIEFDIIFDVLHFEVMPPEGIDGTLSFWSPAWGSIRFKEPIVTRIY